MGHLALFVAVQVLVLEVDDRVVVPDGCFEQPFGVVRRSRGDHLEAGCVDEPGLRILGVEGASPQPTSRRGPDHNRHRRTPAVVIGGGKVHQLVEGTRDEVGKLHLGHGAHTHQGRTDGRPGDGYLRHRRIQHPLGAEVLDKALSDLKGTTVHADVLPQQEDILVPLHLLPKGVADRLKICDLSHNLPSTKTTQAAPGTTHFGHRARLS